MARRPGAAFLLFSLVFAIHAPTLGYEFVGWDDPINISENPLLNPLRWESLMRFWQGPYEGLYVPLTSSLWALLAAVSPRGPDGALSPLFFHLANVLLHALNSALVYGILRKLVAGVAPALVGAAVFGLHPIQVESVAWVTGLKEVLFGTFSLLSIFSLVSREIPRALPKWIAPFFFATLATLCKPTGVALPLLLAWIERVRFGSPPAALARRYGPLGLILAPLAALAVSAQPMARGLSVSIGERFIVAGDAITFYLGKLIVPYPLLRQYDHALEDVLSRPVSYATAALAFGGLATLFSVRKGKGARSMTGAFLIPLLPVMGFVPFWYQRLSTVADRYLYLPMFGVAWGIAWVAEQLSLRVPRAAWIGGLALLGAGSIAQGRMWRDARTLATRTVERHPRSAPAHLELGVLAARDESDSEKAIGLFQRAIEIDPAYADAYSNLGCAYGTRERFAEAIQAFEKALELKPELAAARFNLAKALSFTGRIDEAAPHFIEVIRLRPDLEFEAHFFAGDALARRGNFAAARMHFESALRIRPESSDVRNRLNAVIGASEARKGAQ